MTAPLVSLSWNEAAKLLGVSYSEMNSLLRLKKMPLPVIVDRWQPPVFWKDELVAAKPDVEKVIARWRKH